MHVELLLNARLGVGEKKKRKKYMMQMQRSHCISRKLGLLATFRHADADLKKQPLIEEPWPEISHLLRASDPRPCLVRNAVHTISFQAVDCDFGSSEEHRMGLHKG